VGAEVTTPDLATADGMMAFTGHYGDRVRRFFNERDRVIPLVGIVATWNAPARRSFAEPTGIEILMPDMDAGPTFDQVERQKTLASRFIRRLAIESKAIGVVTAMECWLTTNMSFRGKDFAKDPERQEVIVLLAEHIRFPAARLLTAKISRDAAGKGTAAPYVENEGVRMSGRFTDLLDRERYA
jgi:hypothetical protein